MPVWARAEGRRVRRVRRAMSCMVARIWIRWMLRRKDELEMKEDDAQGEVELYLFILKQKQRQLSSLATSPMA